MLTDNVCSRIIKYLSSDTWQVLFSNKACLSEEAHFNGDGNSRVCTICHFRYFLQVNIISEPILEGIFITCFGEYEFQ